MLQCVNMLRYVLTYYSVFSVLQCVVCYSVCDQVTVDVNMLHCMLTCYSVC